MRKIVTRRRSRRISRRRSRRSRKFKGGGDAEMMRYVRCGSNRPHCKSNRPYKTLLQYLQHAEEINYEKYKDYLTKEEFDTFLVEQTERPVNKFYYDNGDYLEIIKRTKKELDEEVLSKKKALVKLIQNSSQINLPARVTDTLIKLIKIL